MVTFAHLEGFAKVSPYPFICSSSVWKALNPFLLEPKMNDVFIGWLYVEEHHVYLTFYLQMTLLFCRATMRDVQVLTEVLQTYADGSGQCINIDKSSVYFSTNTATDLRERIKVDLGVREVDRFEYYLGLPTLVSQAKFQTFFFP